MALLTIAGIEKTYGTEPILEDVGIVVHAGDRIGVVGPNGSGKTTLFRILIGKETPDKGSVSRARGLSVGYLPQDPELDLTQTATEAALEALAHVKDDEARLRELEHLMAETSDPEQLEEYVAEHARCTERFERGGGYHIEVQARAVLAGLGLDHRLHDQPTGTLSGGEKCRVALARILLQDPDLLLLDEPTNHLDLSGTEWLEDYLVNRTTALLVISHDRRFLDRVTNRTFAFSAAGTHVYDAPYSTYEHLRQEELKALAREVEKQQDFIRKEKEFIRKHLGSQRSREAKGRRTRLQRVEVLSLPPKDRNDLRLDLSPARRSGEVPLQAEGLAMGFGDRILFRDLSFTLEPGERLGIVGDNGTGKSTLLKALAGRLVPAAGKVDLGRNVDLGYYDQEMADLPRDRTVYQAIHDLFPKWTDLEMRSFLARLLFFDEDIDRDLAVCSGGERGRVALARILLRRPNMLFLDEPTNHLDIPARQALENLLEGFTGTLVVVSHDRWFLDRVTTRTLWVTAEGVTLYPGPFSDALARRREALKRKRAEAEAAKAERPAKDAPKPPAPKKVKRRSIDQVEREIIALEDEKAKLLALLGTPEIYTDGAKVKSHQERLAALDASLAALNAEWESLG